MGSIHCQCNQSDPKFKTMEHNLQQDTLEKMMNNEQFHNYINNQLPTNTEKYDVCTIIPETSRNNYNENKNILNNNSSTQQNSSSYNNYEVYTNNKEIISSYVKNKKNFTNYNNTGNKAPLEVINEMNGELSRDSFLYNESHRGTFILSETIKNSVNFKNSLLDNMNFNPNHNYNIIDGKQVTNSQIESNLIAIINTLKGGNESEYNNKNKGNTGSSTPIQIAEAKSRGKSSNNKKEENKRYDMIPKPANASSSIRLEDKKRQNEKSLERKKKLKSDGKVKLIKKVIEGKDINDSWKDIMITNLIPESKLLNSGEGIILYINL